jgi:hypothetical protein
MSLHRLIKDRRAGVTPMFALLLVPLIAADQMRWANVVIGS